MTTDYDGEFYTNTGDRQHMMVWHHACRRLISSENGHNCPMSGDVRRQRRHLRDHAISDRLEQGAA